MSILETPMALCSCGGRFRFDAQYLMDARRFGVALHTPILWRCSMCGRSLTRAGRPSPDYGFAPEAPPRDAAWGERYFHLSDPDGHALSFARPIQGVGG